MVTSTYGVGQLIEAAVAQGATRVVVGLGGSGTNDGGAGMLAALGAGDPDALAGGGAKLWAIWTTMRWRGSARSVSGCTRRARPRHRRRLAPARVSWRECGLRAAEGRHTRDGPGARVRAGALHRGGPHGCSLRQGPAHRQGDATRPRAGGRGGRRAGLRPAPARRTSGERGAGGARGGRLRCAGAGPPTWSSPARARSTGRACAARSSPGWPKPLSPGRDRPSSSPARRWWGVATTMALGISGTYAVAENPDPGRRRPGRPRGHPQRQDGASGDYMVPPPRLTYP